MTEIAEKKVDKLTTEEMVALLAEPGAAESAYQIAETYERVEQVYNASLNIGAFGSTAVSTNQR